MTTRIALPNLDEAEPAVSRFELERYIAGELTDVRRAELTALLHNDAALKARHDAIVDGQKTADAALRLEIPFERFLADHAARTRSPLTRLVASLTSGRALAALGTACAMGAVLFAVTRTPSSTPDLDGAFPGVREKGGARVGFFVRDTVSAHRGDDGERLGAGAQIQFAVKDAAAGHAMVLVGVDGRGAVTIYDAEKIDGERPKGDTKPRLLPQSVVLDDSTGAERFFVVYGDAALDEVRAQAERAAHEIAHADLATTERLPLPSSFVQSSVHIVKVAH